MGCARVCLTFCPVTFLNIRLRARSCPLLNRLCRRSEMWGSTTSSKPERDGRGRCGQRHRPRRYLPKTCTERHSRQDCMMAGASSVNSGGSGVQGGIEGGNTRKAQFSTTHGSWSALAVERGRLCLSVLRNSAIPGGIREECSCERGGPTRCG